MRTKKIVNLLASHCSPAGGGSREERRGGQWGCPGSTAKGCGCWKLQECHQGWGGQLGHVISTKSDQADRFPLSLPPNLLRESPPISSPKRLRPGRQHRLGCCWAHQRQDEARCHARRGSEDAAGAELEPARHAAGAARAAVTWAGTAGMWWWWWWFGWDVVEVIWMLSDDIYGWNAPQYEFLWEVGLFLFGEKDDWIWTCELLISCYELEEGLSIAFPGFGCLRMRDDCYECPMSVVVLSLASQRFAGLKGFY